MLARINAECDKWPYVYFVTLTYADRYLPRLNFRCFRSYDSQGGFSDVYPGSGKFDWSAQDAFYTLRGKFSDFAFTQAHSFGFRVSVEDLKPVYERVQLPFVPVLNYRDVQLFLKRLRSLLKYKIENENDEFKTCSENDSFKYFVCGEYGPLHFRPHYHLLLFTRSELVADRIAQSVPEVWTFGFSDTSLARGESRAYVCGYLNSYLTLPRFYRGYCRFWRPFFRASSGFGQQVLDVSQMSEEQIFQLERFDDCVEPCGSTYVQRSDARQNFSRLFTPLRSFFKGDCFQVYCLFKRFSAVYRKFGYTVDGVQQAKGTLKTAVSTFLGESLLFAVVGSKVCFVLDADIYPSNSLTGYICYQYTDGSPLIIEPERLYNRVYHLFRSIDKFLKLFCTGLYDFYSQSLGWFSRLWNMIHAWRDRLGVGSLSPYFSKIENFEHDLRSRGYPDLIVRQALARFTVFRVNHTCSNRESFDDSGFTFFRRKRCLIWKQAAADLRDFFLTKIKHREMNDALLFNSKYLNSYGFTILNE